MNQEEKVKFLICCCYSETVRRCTGISALFWQTLYREQIWVFTQSCLFVLQ